MRKLDWEDIKFLGQVVQAGSARAAGKRMGVHHSTVSRRLESLEHAIGTRLLLRNRDGYALTEAGELLASSAHAIELEVARAERLLAGGDQALSGRIVVAMAPAVATHVFAPRLFEFTDSHPELSLSIVSSYHMADLSKREADVVVRLSDSPSEDLFGKRLFSYYNCAYASPAYLRGSSSNAGAASIRWIGWSELEDVNRAALAETEFPAAPIWGCFPDVSLQAELAVQGLGVAFLPCLVGDQTNDLVRASECKPLRGRDVWLLTHNDLRKSQKIRVFMQFAEMVLRDARNLFEGQ